MRVTARCVGEGAGAKHVFEYLVSSAPNPTKPRGRKIGEDSFPIQQGGRGKRGAMRKRGGGGSTQEKEPMEGCGDFNFVYEEDRDDSC